MAIIATTEQPRGQGLEPEHTHPAQVHIHDHYHLAHVHAAGGDPEWRHQANWHTHEHDHRAVMHSHDFAEANEAEHHARRAHVHDHMHPVHGGHL